MSKGHTAVNEFLEKKTRYADLFNGNLFRGAQVVLPEELEMIKGESDILVEDKTKHVKDVHYAMPVRKMLYDSLSYVEQIKRIWDTHEMNPKDDKMTKQEYLSQFGKQDKLTPVITVVFYYGKEDWDGSTDLYGMFANHAFLENEMVQKYIPNYWINLIDVNSMADISCFRTDLKEIFGMMKCRKDKQALIDYMQSNEPYFRHVDKETYYAIGELLQLKTILEKEVAKEEERDMDMCKALEDLYQDGVNEGQEIGKNEKLRELVSKKMQKGDSIEKIADDLLEEISLIQQIVEELQKKTSGIR